MRGTTSHNRPPSPDSAPTTKITSKVKKMAAQDLFKPASGIVDEASLLKIVAYIARTVILRSLSSTDTLWCYNRNQQEKKSDTVSHFVKKMV